MSFEAPMVFIDWGFRFITLVEGQILLVQDMGRHGYCSLPGLTT